MDHVIRILDILTDLPVLLAVAFVCYRKPLARFFQAFVRDHLPDLVRQMSRLRVGQVEIEFAELQQSMGRFSPGLVNAVLREMSPDVGVAEAAERVDDNPLRSPTGQVETAQDLEEYEEEPGDGTDEDEFRRKLADVLGGNGRTE